MESPWTVFARNIRGESRHELVHRHGDVAHLALCGHFVSETAQVLLERFQRKWWFRNCLPNLGVHLLLQVVVSLLLFNFPVVSFGVFSVLHVLEVLRKRVDPDSFSKHVRDLALAHEDAIVFEQFFDLHAVELQRAVRVELHEHLIDYFFSFYLCRRVEVVGVRVGWSVRLKPLFEFVAVQQCVRFFLRDDDGGPRINLLQTLNRL